MTLLVGFGTMVMDVVIGEPVDGDRRYSETSREFGDNSEAIQHPLWDCPTSWRGCRGVFSVGNYPIDSEIHLTKESSN